MKRAKPAFSSYYIVSDLDDTAIAALKSDVESGKSHPLQVKHDLARTICAGYHGEEAANKAESEFKRVFSERQRPTDIEERVLTAVPNVVMAVLLADTGLASSRSEARRLIAQGGVRVDGEKFTLPTGELVAVAGSGYEIKVGKRRFLRVRFE